MKNRILLAIAALVLLTPAAQAAKLTFDPATSEGRAAAYAAMNEYNAVGNANRLIRNLNSVSRSNADLSPLASKLIPQLQELVTKLGGETAVSNR